MNSERSRMGSDEATIPRLVTVWVDTKEPKDIYKEQLHRIGSTMPDEIDRAEIWGCMSPFGAVIVRCEGVRLGSRMEMEGTLRGIQHILETLSLSDVPQSIQSVVVGSRREFPGPHTIC